MWLGKTTHSGEHIIALKNNEGVAFYTRSLSRMTGDQQWNRELFNATAVPMMDTTMRPMMASEDAIIGRAIID
eukprot:5240401-Amphidinium_carterae.1